MGTLNTVDKLNFKFIDSTGLLRVSQANEVPISSHIRVTSNDIQTALIP